MPSASPSFSHEKGGAMKDEEGAQEAREAKSLGDRVPQDRVSSGYLKIVSILYYMLSSILVQSSNKALFTIWGFQFPLLIAFLQLSFTSVVMFFVAKPTLSLQTARIVAPLALTNVCNIVAGLVGTAGMNVPMFIALRRCSLITTLICQYALYNKTQDWGTLGQIGLMVGGALIAAINDLTFNVYGYTAAFVNNIFTSTYLVLVKNIKHDLTTNGLLFYNNALSLPLLALALHLTPQGTAWANFPELHNPSFLITLVGSSCLGLTISHSTFLCTKHTDPLTVQVAGSWKNIFMTLLGAVAFGDFVFEGWNVLGLAISMVGSCIYGYSQVLKHNKHSKSSQPSERPEAAKLLEGGRGSEGASSSHEVDISRENSLADRPPQAGKEGPGQGKQDPPH